MDDLVDFLPADFPEDAFLALENKLGYEFGPAELPGLYSDFYATRRNYNRMLKEQQSKCSKISKPNFSKEDLLELPSIFFGVNALYGSYDKENVLIMKSRRKEN